MQSMRATRRAAVPKVEKNQQELYFSDKGGSHRLHVIGLLFFEGSSSAPCKTIGKQILTLTYFRVIVEQQQRTRMAEEGGG